MFGRRNRTLIPMTSELLKPKIVEYVQGKLLKRKQLQAKHYNISAKELPPLSKGEIVRVKPTDKSGRWIKESVEQQVDVRSYEVRTEDGKIFRRNRRHLRSSREPACVRINPVPIHMPNQTRVPESLTIPKPSVTPPKTSAPLEVPPPKKPESSSQTGKVPEQSSPPKPVDCPVTQSDRMSRPPSYLKDFVVAK